MSDDSTLRAPNRAERSRYHHGRSLAGYHAEVPRTSAVPISWIFMGALVQIGLSFPAPKLSVLLGAAIAAWAVWQARSEFLPTLIVVQFSSANFLFSGAGPSTALFVNIGGFPVSVPYVIAVTLTSRVVYEMFTQSTFRASRISWLIWLWLSAMPFTLIMALMGRAEGNPSWMSPVRVILMAGAFFYGIILKQSWPEDGRLLRSWLMPLVVTVFLLADLGVFWHRFLFIFVSLGFPLGVFGFKYGGLFGRGLGVVCALLTADYGLGLGLVSRVGIGRIVAGGGEEGPGSAGGLLGGSTFTLSLVTLVSVLLSIVYFLPKVPVWRPVVGRLIRTCAFPVVVIFSVTIAVLSPRYSYSGPSNDMRVDPGSAPLTERAMYKLFDDRSVIWNATLENILNPPYILRPSGRPLIMWLRGGEEEVPFGSHNVVLETMKSLRWVAGPILLTMLAVAMAGCARTLYLWVTPSYGVLAIATLATAIIGSITGHYSLTDEVSFLFMGMAGLGWTVQNRMSMAHPAKNTKGSSGVQIS